MWSEQKIAGLWYKTAISHLVILVEAFHSTCGLEKSLLQNKLHDTLQFYNKIESSCHNMIWLKICVYIQIKVFPFLLSGNTYRIWTQITCWADVDSTTSAQRRFDCRPNITDAGPTSDRHWANFGAMLGQHSANIGECWADISLPTICQHFDWLLPTFF